LALLVLLAAAPAGAQPKPAIEKGSAVKMEYTLKDESLSLSSSCARQLHQRENSLLHARAPEALSQLRLRVAKHAMNGVSLVEPRSRGPLILTFVVFVDKPFVP